MMIKGEVKWVSGDFVREKRLYMKKSRSNLAKDVGVTESYIAKLENGVITNPTLVVLKGLSKALNVSPLEFFK